MNKTFTRHQEVVDPDGRISTVLLFDGNYVTVERLCYRPGVHRFKSFHKDQFKRDKKEQGK